MIFYKFHGNGNDFVAVDNINSDINLTEDKVKQLCHRRYGVGADGLIEIKRSNNAQFELVYYNSDGKVGSMCGNGGRCAVAFAHYNGIFKSNSVEFMAYDGLHKAIVREKMDSTTWEISLQLSDVSYINKEKDTFVLNTGSPHYVEFVDNVEMIDVVEWGRQIRYSDKFSPDGLNVNFVERREGYIYVRTYERGVEDETLSCGTGVTASSIAEGIDNAKQVIDVKTRGGDFRVTFEINNDKRSASNIWLNGPAKMVFKGEYFE